MRVSSSWLWLLALGAAVSAAGCKKDDGGASLPSAELAARYAEIRCRSAEACCKQQGVTVDGASCRQSVRADLQEDVDEMLMSRVSYDGAAAGECMDTFAASASCDLDADEDLLEDTPACDRMFAALQAPGQPCTRSEECQEGVGESADCNQPYDPATQTVGSGACRVRKLIALKHGVQGGPCNRTCGSSCSDVVDVAADAAPLPNPRPGDGIACYRSDNLRCSSNSTCQPLVALGQPCENYDDCSGDLFCDVDAAPSTRTCMARRPLGAECDRGDQCQSDSCDGVVCRPATITASDCSSID